MREHSGWAAVVVLAGGAGSPVLVERRRIELLAGDAPRQPFHAAAGLGDVAAAERLIRRAQEVASEAAQRELVTLGDELAARGWPVAGLAVAALSGRVPDAVERILPSHALLHAAEGELYREAVVDAASLLGWRLTRFPPKGVMEAAAAALGLSAGAVATRVAELGRGLGPPWREDQKLAAAAAWLVLAGYQGAAGVRRGSERGHGAGRGITAAPDART